MWNNFWTAWWIFKVQLSFWSLNPITISGQEKIEVQSFEAQKNEHQCSLGNSKEDMGKFNKLLLAWKLYIVNIEVAVSLNFIASNFKTRSGIVRSSNVYSANICQDDSKIHVLNHLWPLRQRATFYLKCNHKLLAAGSLSSQSSNKSMWFFVNSFIIITKKFGMTLCCSKADAFTNNATAASQSIICKATHNKLFFPWYGSKKDTIQGASNCRFLQSASTFHSHVLWTCI